ncbi:MAG: hypothetical protein IH845_05475, partial [Nanoarchaeota archaeon]|nr:hypothetical protein [Nanoarchaeota archaeon]
MLKLKKHVSSRHIIASLISVSILTLLLLAGPVQAFILDLSVDNTILNKGDSVTFTATLEFENLDKFLPIKNLTLIMDGPERTECVFDISGTVLSGCEGMTINLTDGSYFQGEGDRFGYSYGYGYDFGYGYGYGYGDGSVGGVLEYEIILDTENYSIGTYNTSLEAIIGDETFSKEGSQVEIFAEDTIILNNFGGGSGGSGNGTISLGVITLNNNNNESEDNEANQTLFTGLNDPAPTGGFFSRITGA